MTDTKPWYLSRTIWASLVAIGLSVAGALGASTETIDGAGLTEALVQAATGLAGLVALFGRLSASKKIG
jgi:hypothetical protein